MMDLKHTTKAELAELNREQAATIEAKNVTIAELRKTQAEEREWFNLQIDVLKAEVEALEAARDYQAQLLGEGEGTIAELRREVDEACEDAKFFQDQSLQWQIDADYWTSSAEDWRKLYWRICRMVPLAFLTGIAATLLAGVVW